MEASPSEPTVEMPSKQGKRVLVTGASGLLGRQVFRLLEEGGSSWSARGLYSSRAGDKLVRCDLTKEEDVERQFTEFSPDIVVHLAAERRPDICHKKPSDSQALNVDVTHSVAKACKKFKAWMIYVSTDYVFDGTAPPYTVDAIPNPLSEYAQQKVEGERVTLQENSTAAVLRIPLLYGEMEYLKESGVTALLPDMQSGAMTNADHYQQRYPTYTSDVAKIIVKMLEAHCLEPDSHPLSGIFHWQADECLSKFDMVQLIAELEQMDASAIVAHTEPPRFPAPKDSRLDCSRLIQALGIDPVHFRTPIRDGLGLSLQKLAKRTEVAGSSSAGYDVIDVAEAPAASSKEPYIVAEQSKEGDDVVDAPASKIVRLSPPTERSTISVA